MEKHVKDSCGKQAARLFDVAQECTDGALQDKIIAIACDGELTELWPASRLFAK
jgi:hypothetical protein